MAFDGDIGCAAEYGRYYPLKSVFPDPADYFALQQRLTESCQALRGSNDGGYLQVNHGILYPSRCRR